MPKQTNTTDTIIPFGKHKGKTIKEVNKIEKDYLEWLLTADRVHYKLRREIQKSLGIPFEKDIRTYLLDFLDMKLEKHLEKYPTFEKDRLFEWINTKPTSWISKRHTWDIAKINDRFHSYFKILSWASNGK